MGKDNTVYETWEATEARKGKHLTLIDLPPEILHGIVLCLKCPALISLSRTCKRLQSHAENDLLWASLIRPNLLHFPVSPYPSNSWRSLYISHHPCWFLPRFKIWFSDIPHLGKIILCKFDPRRGCIEGYELLAERRTHHIQPWSHLNGVFLHSFSHRLHLYTDNPVLKLEQFDPALSKGRHGRWDGEIKMKTSPAIFSTLFLCKSIPKELQHNSMELWPPRIVPDMPRVRSTSQDNFKGWGHKPRNSEEISETTFRLRKWSQFSVGGTIFGVRMGEGVSTWSTLDPALYMPTKEKPYQG